MKMKKVKFAIAALTVCLVIGVFFVLRSEHTLVTHPKGLIAHSELDLIIKNYLLMFIIIIPTFIFLFFVIFKYWVKNSKAQYDPEHSHGPLGELMLWIIPSVIVAVLVVITWRETHRLDPYKPLESTQEPLTIQVVALDWKWLFIYPEQGIATLNFVQFPEQTPIHFELAADGSPMNSFWIPQLSGQIYAMTGMITQLHMMADAPGEYSGKAAEINGRGYADMTFTVKSTTPEEFEDWVSYVKQSPLQLTDSAYEELCVPSEKNPVVLYSEVEEDLFNKIVMKYMHM